LFLLFNDFVSSADVT